MQAPEGSQKDVLDRVFGILASAEHPQAEAVHETFEPLDEPAHRRLVTGNAAFDQTDLGLDHKGLAGGNRILRCGLDGSYRSRGRGVSPDLFLDALADDLPRRPPAVPDGT